MSKRLKIVVSALLLFAVLAGIGIVSAAPPPAPVGQEVGRTDTIYTNVTATECRGCHGGPYALKPTGGQTHPARDTHHAMIGKRAFLPNMGTSLGCYDCHPNVLQPDGSYAMYVEDELNGGDCKSCHTNDGSAWSRNYLVNMTVLRGYPGRPHHNASKNSSSDTISGTGTGFGVKGAVQVRRECKFCHGDTVIDNWNDGHQVKNLEPQLVSVFSDFKINATTGNGIKWGGCASCHEPADSNPILNDNEENHHYEVLEASGYPPDPRGYTGPSNRSFQCNSCHVSFGPRTEPKNDLNPEPSAAIFRVWFNATGNPYYNFYQMFNWDSSKRHFEVSNNTMLLAGDTVNGTGCLKCHSYKDLHNIEANGPNTKQYNIDNRIPGYGHIGNNTDCSGCHAGWSESADLRPIIAPLSHDLQSIAPGSIVAGTDTTVTLTGDGGFDQSPTYTTQVLMDGQPVAIQSIADKQIVVTIPGITEAGTHAIQVDVGGVTGSPVLLSIGTKVTIASATLSSGTINITGTTFGTDAQELVTINKAEGMVGSDSIVWSDTQIVATSSVAAVGDTVTVTTPYGSATATITAGTVPDSLAVTVPNTNVNWKRGTTKTITWDRAGTSQAANVRIELLKGTSVNRVIASSATNSGTYSWTIPGNQATGTNFKMRITSVGHTPSYSDSSDTYFQISK